MVHSSLLSAAEVGNVFKVQQLLEAGVSPLCTDGNGHTPLHKCAFMGFDPVSELSEGLSEAVGLTVGLTVGLDCRTHCRTLSDTVGHCRTHCRTVGAGEVLSRCRRLSETVGAVPTFAWLSSVRPQSL